MAWYRTGTVSVTNGWVTVTGSGTAWIGPVKVGDAFLGPDGRSYEIASLVSGTAFTIVGGYLGATMTGADYSVVPTQSRLADLSGGVAALIDSFQSASDVAANINSDIIPGWQAQLDAFIAAAEDDLVGDIVAADPGLRRVGGVMQRHTMTGVAKAGGHTLRAFGESRAVWIDPAGGEHVGDAYVTATGGPYQLWMPVADINPTGTDLRLNAGGSMTHLHFPANAYIRYLNVSGSDLEHLDLRQHRDLSYISAFNNDFVELDLSLNTALVTAYLYGNPLAELATDHLVNLQILSVSHCALTDGFETSRLAAMTLLHAHNNTMTQTGVDRVLVGLDTAGVSDCTIKIDGNNEPPSSAGATAATNLNARGCTVTHS